MESGVGAEAEIAAQLHSQRGDLGAQLARESEWTRNEARRLTAAAEELDHDIRLLAVAMQTQQKQMALTQEHADRIRDLAEQGTVSRDELQRRDLAVLSQRLAVQNADRELAAKRARSSPRGSRSSSFRPSRTSACARCAKGSRTCSSGSSSSRPVARWSCARR